MNCQECGYLLKGLPETGAVVRCPECGWQSSVLREPSGAGAFWNHFGPFAICFAFWLGVISPVLVRVMTDEREVLVYASTLVCLAVAATSSSLAWKKLRQTRAGSGGFRRLRALRWAIALCIAGALVIAAGMLILLLLMYAYSRAM